ncbi:Mutanase [Cercospora beticola]|uniref:Mutanase n=1 Tax=Cercospora beticola TaxID=122368 RepID=A0A2G5HM05_CERBT|nr:Mutanase [Cercospora beticola]PIA93577.1 Mutanase [Cercospora beticola]WPB01950.1 hypothetical protein RHO25_006583 [Cercospora beticola]CAK1363204.1 unnamed protein product [Cercospora beticola]
MSWFTLLMAALAGASAVEAKAVMAHFMLANSYSYSLADWQYDIKAAQDASIDAFALNMAYNPSSQLDQSIANAFQAANSLGFKLLFSFDYAGNGPWPASAVINYMKQYGPNSAHMTYNGKPIATTFEGTQNSGDWANIKSQTNCFFVPEWASIGPSAAASASGGVADGLFSWEAWPNGPNDMTTSRDQQWISAAGREPYMMGVSPWFYANVPTWSKNWLWRGDDLWYDRWSQVLQLQPEWVQIISWNDWPESHYIGPQRNADFGAFAPGGAPYNYAQDMPHDGWRALLPYWISTYKNGGVQPVANETLEYWYRLSPKNACGDGGTSGNTASHGQQQYRAAEVVQDNVFFTALLDSPADAIVTIGGVNTTATWRNKPSGGRGLYHGSVPFNGRTGQVSISVVRNGNTVIQQTGKPISTSCQNGVTNWNAWVGSAVGNAPGAVSSSSSTTTSRAATSSTSTSSLTTSTRSTTTIPASSSTSTSTTSRTSTGTSTSTTSTRPASSSSSTTRIPSSSITTAPTTTPSGAAVTSTLTMQITLTQNIVCVCSPNCACSPVGAPAAIAPATSAATTSSTAAAATGAAVSRSR